MQSAPKHGVCAIEGISGRLCQVATEDKRGVKSDDVEVWVVLGSPVEGCAMSEDLRSMVFKSTAGFWIIGKRHLGVDWNAGVETLWSLLAV